MQYDPISHVHGKRNQVASNLQKIYSGQSDGNGNKLMKSDESDQLIKGGGEGSRGGKIIGHTKSGKPIYDKYGHAAHKNFNSQDHLDASDAHMKELSDNNGNHTAGYHDEQSASHYRAYESKESVIGKTKSGKNIHNKFDHPDHKNFTSDDHADAVEVHKENLKGKNHKNAADSINDKDHSEMHKHLNASTKKNKEEIDVIGKTRSGKKIRGTHDTPGHEDFDAEDHLDAANAHTSKREAEKKRIQDEFGNDKNEVNGKKRVVHEMNESPVIALHDEERQKHLDSYGKAVGIKKSEQASLENMLEKGEISDAIASGYGAGSVPIKFVKTGKEIKARLPIIKNSLVTQIASIEAQMAALKMKVGKEPDRENSRRYDKMPAVLRYDYKMAEPVYENGRYSDKTEENELCTKYNALVYLWNELKDDYDAICVIENNLQDDKKFEMSVSQLIALSFN